MEEKMLKKILAIIGIFIMGFLVGSQSENMSIKSIQGYLFNAIGYATDFNATGGNATNGNATGGNATNGNATGGNATSGNATSGNVSITDNILYLQSFSIKNNSVKPGEKIYLELTTTGANKQGGTILLKNDEKNTSITSIIKSLNNKPYIIIPENALSGTYKISKIILIGVNSNYTTFNRTYSAYDNTDFKLNFLNQSIEVQEKTVKEPDKTTTTTGVQSNNNLIPENNINNNNKNDNNNNKNDNNNKENNNKDNTKIVLENILLKTNINNITDKVYLEYKTNIKVSNIKLTFINDTNDKLDVYLKSITKNPYFEIPSDTRPGTYKLNSITLSNNNNSIMYSLEPKNGVEKLNFDVTTTINDYKNQDTYIFNNENITDEIINSLYNAKETATINITANNDTIIDKEIFNVIKGTNKKVIINYFDNQIIFNGKDIKEPKTIDVVMKTSLIEENSEISKIINKGILLEFSPNGKLPGKTIIKIKITEEIKNILNEKINVYYYNELNNNFTEISLDLVPKEDFYEFEIEHNSKYIMTSDEIKEELLSNQEPTVEFEPDSSISISLIIISVLIIIVVTIIIVVINNNKKNKKIQ